MALEIGSRLGHYDVTALIGEGGMGQVYQATVVVWLLVGLLFAGTPASAQPGCLGHPVAVQVLGSGGPASVEGRASSKLSGLDRWPSTRPGRRGWGIACSVWGVGRSDCRP